MTKTIKTLAVLAFLTLSTNANADWKYHTPDGVYWGWDRGNNTAIFGPDGYEGTLWHD